MVSGDQERWTSEIPSVGFYFPSESRIPPLHHGLTQRWFQHRFWQTYKTSILYRGAVEVGGQNHTNGPKKQLASFISSVLSFSFSPYSRFNLNQFKDFFIGVLSAALLFAKGIISYSKQLYEKHRDYFLSSEIVIFYPIHRSIEQNEILFLRTLGI